MRTFVRRFDEGDKDQKDLLGGKGANLAEMTRLGLPVPPGFTVTTEACRRYLADGVVPPELRVQVTRALRALEDRIGRQLDGAVEREFAAEGLKVRLTAPLGPPRSPDA